MSSQPTLLLPDENEDQSAPDIVDDEDTGRGDSDFKPWDPSKIRITTKHFSLRDVVDQITDAEIDLSPDFQRDYVWKKRQRTRLVESVLLGIPLPAFYFNQDHEGTYQVVDGVQRLSTIALFMGDGHILEKADLEYLTNLDGLKYSQLDPASLRRFRSAQIIVHVIEPQTPDEVKYDIFGRVNTLGSPLSAQEIRHAMSKARSREFLKHLAEMPSFDLATGWQYWRRDPDVKGGRIRDSGRMTNRELALRFCAFRNYTDEEYRQHSSLDAFLVEYTRRLDSNSESGVAIDDDEIAQLSADFDRAMENAHHVLGKAAFRRWPPTQSRRGPINRAVFESQSIALADYPLERLMPKKAEIVTAFRGAFDELDYARSVTVGTGDPKAVERRLARTQAILAEILK
ncbi:DUF262 domain-containing protein [Cupriavidus numazuensis]|uniref:GmrSD restriction endonucleases N-terminal domain-containing protein n=1 Tax=Cupriavidus numazuensis TaxID=221992 RepID=A0ABN7QAP0_9BURK|nr:DUF262 domain-containing protein [Cupriavidus numazuensis]CAG2159545.1 hypothetical protein LMG26411_06782 [Cupriavidus numazuensis]